MIAVALLLKIPDVTVRHVIQAPDLGYWPYVFAGLLVLLILSVISRKRD